MSHNVLCSGTFKTCDLRSAAAEAAWQEGEREPQGSHTVDGRKPASPHICIYALY